MSDNPPSSEPVETGMAQAPAPPEAPAPSLPPPVSPAAGPVVANVQQPPPPAYTSASTPPPQPQAPQATPSAQQPPAAPYEPTHDQISHRRRNTAAVVLIILGVVFLLGQFLPSWSWDKWWPLVLILIGVYIIFQGRRRKP